MFVCLFVCLLVSGSECGAVGVENRSKIPDARITASTYYGITNYPYYGRLNGNRGDGAWCAETTTGRTDYLQVDMGAVHSVCAVATQGESKFAEWTRSYKLRLSTDGVTWNSYKENNAEKVTKIIHSFLGMVVDRKVTTLSHSIGQLYSNSLPRATEYKTVIM